MNSDKEIICYMVSDTFYPNVSGVGTVVDALMRELPKVGITTKLIVPRVKVDRSFFPFPIMENHSFNPNGTYPISHFHIDRKIRKEILAHKGHCIIHSHADIGLGWAMSRFAKKHGIPFISTIHTRYYDDVKGMIKFPPLVAILIRLMASSFNRSDFIFTINLGARTLFLDHGLKAEIPYAQIDNPVNFTLRDASGVDLKLLLKGDPPEETMKLLFVGAITYRKNIQFLIRVAEILRIQNFPFRFIMVGRGNDEKAIKHTINKLGLRDYFTFLGVCNHLQIQKLCEYADLFCFPSFFDVFGLVVYEAARCGLPSLLIKGSDVARNVSDQGNGFLSENDPQSYAAYIMELYRNPGLRTTVGERARKTLISNTDEILETLKNKYRELIATKGQN